MGQGMLMVTQCVLCLLFLSGLYSVLMGVLCRLVSFGIQPDIETWPSTFWGLSATSATYPWLRRRKNLKASVARALMEGQLRRVSGPEAAEARKDRADPWSLACELYGRR